MRVYSLYFVKRQPVLLEQCVGRTLVDSVSRVGVGVRVEVLQREMEEVTTTLLPVCCLVFVATASLTHL